jgi:hypothetical protein
MRGAPLIITDFLATGAIALAMIVIVKTLILATPISRIEGLKNLAMLV